MTHANFQYRLVQRPGSIHFNMGFLDRWHRAQGIYTCHEGEGCSLQVITASGAHKIHILGIIQPHLFKHRSQLRHDQLDFVGGACMRYAVRLVVGNNSNIFHRLSPPIRRQTYGLSSPPVHPARQSA